MLQDNREAEKTIQGGEVIGEKKKSKLQHAGSGSGGGILGEGEVKGNFASEDIRKKRNAFVKVEEQNLSDMTTNCGKSTSGKSVYGREFISWMEGLKSSNMPMCEQDAKQGRGSEMIVDVRDEEVEEERQEDCFGEKNIDNWMKELKVEEERCSQEKVLGGVVDADDEGGEEEHTLGVSYANAGELELEGCSSTIRLSLPREENLSKQYPTLGTHFQQNFPPVYLMKEGEVHRVKIFRADSPSYMVGRPVDLEKEYQELLNNLSSLFSLKSHGTCLPIEGGLSPPHLREINLNNQDHTWQPGCRAKAG